MIATSIRCGEGAFDVRDRNFGARCERGLIDFARPQRGRPINIFW
jgi:hypothetical protein